jgi:hypothetical protein
LRYEDNRFTNDVCKADLIEHVWVTAGAIGQKNFAAQMSCITA